MHGILIANVRGAMQDNVISFEKAKQLKQTWDEESFRYQARILSMDKLELLEEMVQFQEKRAQQGQLDPKMMIQGKVLFGTLEKHAETSALRSLARSYRRHLEHELKTYSSSSSLS